MISTYTAGPIYVHTFEFSLPAYRCTYHTNISGRVGENTHFLCKKQYLVYLLSEQTAVQANHIDTIKNTIKMWIAVAPIVYAIHCTPALY